MAGAGGASCRSPTLELNPAGAAGPAHHFRARPSGRCASGSRAAGAAPCRRRDSPRHRPLRTLDGRAPHTPFDLPSPPRSERYYDDVYEYRHVVLPQDIAKRLPKDKLLSEPEWRALGVQQSRGWGQWLEGWGWEPAGQRSSSAPAGN